MVQNDVVKKLIMQVVNNQLRMNKPPEAKETLDRLISEGYSQKDAKELIASVVATHIQTLMTGQTMFDEALYIQQLKQLPELPYDGEE